MTSLLKVVLRQLPISVTMNSSISCEKRANTEEKCIISAIAQHALVLILLTSYACGSLIDRANGIHCNLLGSLYAH